MSAPSSSAGPVALSPFEELSTQDKELTSLSTSEFEFETMFKRPLEGLPTPYSKVGRFLSSPPSSEGDPSPHFGELLRELEDTLEEVSPTRGAEAKGNTEFSMPGQQWAFEP